MSHVPQKLTPAQDLKECAVCTRHFTAGRIRAHEAICQKSAAITRKCFDISHQRISGTEAERCAKTAAAHNFLTKPTKNSPCVLSTNWRGKHENLLKKVKEAKEKANEKYNKVNDLPIPPPTASNTDFVQCPHCSRQINQQSASRHINTCAKKMYKSDMKTGVSEPQIKASQLSLADN